MLRPKLGKSVFLVIGFDSEEPLNKEIFDKFMGLSSKYESGFLGLTIRGKFYDSCDSKTTRDYIRSVRNIKNIRIRDFNNIRKNNVFKYDFALFGGMEFDPINFDSIVQALKLINEIPELHGNISIPDIITIEYFYRRKVEKMNICYMEFEYED